MIARTEAHAGTISMGVIPLTFLLPLLWFPPGGDFFVFGHCDGLDAIKGCWYIKSAALLQSGNRKEVSALEIFTSVLVAVAAGVISHCICKWLDGRQGQVSTKSPPE